MHRFPSFPDEVLPPSRTRALRAEPGAGLRCRSARRALGQTGTAGKARLTRPTSWMQSRWEKAGRVCFQKRERAKGTAAVKDSKETRTGSAPCSRRRQKTSGTSLTPLGGCLYARETEKKGRDREKDSVRTKTD